MADPILINMYIRQLGLTGEDAIAKRKELEKLSNNELNKLLSGVKNKRKEDTFKSEFGSRHDWSSGEKPAPKYTAPQKSAMNFMSSMLTDATKNMYEQAKADGVVGKGVNLFKEIFNTKYAKSNVESAIKNTQKDFDILEDAARGILPDNFEETFKKRRGVEFNPEKIEECTQKAKEMQQFQASADMIDTLKGKLSAALVNNSSNNISRSGEKAILSTLSAMGYTKIGDVIREAIKGHENDPIIKDYVKEGGSFAIKKDKNGNFGIYRETEQGGFQPITQEQAQLIGKEVELRLNKLQSQILGVEIPQNASSKDIAELNANKLKQLQSEYEKSFSEAFGKKDLKNLSQNYMLSQEQGKGYAQMGVNVLAMAGAMFSGGSTLGLVSGAVLLTNPVDFIEKATNADGLTKKDLEDWGSGVAENAGWMILGMGAGKVGDMTRSFVKVKGLSKVIKESGRSFDDVLKLAAKSPDIPADLAKSLKQVSLLSNSLGVSAEVATDIGTTMLLQKDGATTTDWIMSVGGALVGTKMQKVMAPMSKDAKIAHLMDTFKDFKLTEAEAENLLKAMDDAANNRVKTKTGNIDNNIQNRPNELPEVVIKPEEGVHASNQVHASGVADKFTDADNSKLNSILKEYQNRYREYVSDIEIQKIFDEIKQDDYFKKTKDFDLVKKVLDFQSTSNFLIYKRYNNVLIGLNPKSANLMKTLIEFSDTGDSELLKNIDNIRYLSEAMSNKFYDADDVKLIFGMKDEQGNLLVNSSNIDDFEIENFKSFDKMIYDNKFPKLENQLKSRFQYISESDASGILANVKDGYSARILSNILSLKTDSGNPVFNLDSIEATMKFVNDNPKLKIFTMELINDLDGVKLDNNNLIEKSLAEIFKIVQDHNDTFIVDSLMSLYKDKKDINWRVIGYICHNINNSKDPTLFKAIADRALSRYGNDINIINTLCYLNSMDSAELFQNMQNQYKPNQISPFEMTNILKTYEANANSIPNLKEVYNNAIFNDVDPNLVPYFADYVSNFDSNPDVLNFVYDIGSLKDEKGSYRYSRFGIDAILKETNDPNVFNYIAKLTKDYPDITTKQILDNIQGKSITLNDRYQYPFGENGEFRAEYSRIVNTPIWQEIVPQYGGKLYEYFKQLVNTDSNRFKRLVDSGYFELASEGKVDINELLRNLNTNKFFTKSYLNDVKKLYNNEPLVKEYAAGVDLNVVSKEIPSGEVASIGDKLFVNEAGKMVELKISKEVFEMLFPLEKRFTTHQHGIGDCWLISSFDNLMDLPIGRAKLYQLFEQKGDDIIVKFPTKEQVLSTDSEGKLVATLQDSFFSVQFKDGIVVNNDGKQVIACDGIKMLEQAYAIKRAGNYESKMSPIDIEDVVDVNAQMEKLDGGLSSNEFVRYILDLTRIDNAGNLFNEQGEIIGGTMKTDANRDAVHMLVSATANQDNILLHAYTRNVEAVSSRVEKDMDPNYDLFSSHAYTIKGYDKDRGMIYYTNPWNSNTVVEMDIYTFLKYIDKFDYVVL